MNLLAIPIGPMTTASSRVRLYHLLPNIKEKINYDIVNPMQTSFPPPEEWSKYDAIYIQKNSFPHVIDFCSNVVNHVDKPIKIIYDLDDDVGSGMTDKIAEETTDVHEYSGSQHGADQECGGLQKKDLA